MGTCAFAGVLVFSIGLQLAAAAYSILNIRLTSATISWSLISASITLMAVRRMITLHTVIGTWGRPYVVQWDAEIVALIISMLMLGGMIALRRVVLARNSQLQEKDLMLRSSLHTTKNNMQSLVSLLHLQTELVTSEETRNVLMELEQRVAVYAILQHQLYESNAKPDFARYVGDLVTSVSDGYASPDRPVAVKQKVEPIAVSLKELLFCGLVICEAMINAYKHAGVPERTAAITVASGSRNGKRWLEVSDNGPGYAPGILEHGGDGFGLTLLRGLSSTEFRLTFTNRNGALVRAEF